MKIKNMKIVIKVIFVLIVFLIGVLVIFKQYRYHFNEDGTVTIDNYVGKQEDVNIPSKIWGRDVTTIGSYCFKKNNNITSVYIPETVKTIEHGAFLGCENLKKVEGGKNVAVIMSSAFDGNHNLEEIFPLTNLEKIYDCTFWGCNLLENVEISDKVEYIGAMAFADTKVDYKIVPNSTKFVDGLSFSDYGDNNNYLVLGDGILMSFPNEEIIEVPYNVKVVMQGEYKRKKDKVKKMYIPNTVFHVKYDVLESADQSTMYIPESVTQIGRYEECEYEERELINVAKICGIKGSYSEDYAKRYNIPFEEVERWY